MTNRKTTIITITKKLSMYVSSNKNQANHFSKHYMLSDRLCLLSVTFLCFYHSC